jgi:hypothetical protein
MLDGNDCGGNGEIDEWQRKPNYSATTCPSATLFTTDPALLHPGSKPYRRGGKAATDRLSYGTANLNDAKETDFRDS